MKKINLKDPKILLGIPLAIISLELYIGTIIGYLGGKFFCGKLATKPRILKMIKINTFDIGNYQLQLHHWLLCSGIVILAIFYSFFTFLPRLIFGFLGGLIFHDIYFDKDWYKILKKKKN
ncbi:hypothetical protein ACFL0A_00665 [Patescibacteria group bacterium]